MLLLLDTLPRHPPPGAPDPQLQSPGACAGLHPGLPWTGQGVQTGAKLPQVLSGHSRLKAPFLFLFPPGTSGQAFSSPTGPAPVPSGPRLQSLHLLLPSWPQAALTGSCVPAPFLSAAQSAACSAPLSDTVPQGGEGGGYTYSYFHFFPMKVSSFLSCFNFSSTRSVVGVREATLTKTHFPSLRSCCFWL